MKLKLHNTKLFAQGLKRRLQLFGHIGALIIGKRLLESRNIGMKGTQRQRCTAFGSNFRFSHPSKLLKFTVFGAVNNIADFKIHDRNNNARHNSKNKRKANTNTLTN